MITNTFKSPRFNTGIVISQCSIILMGIVLHRLKALISCEYKEITGEFKLIVNEVWTIFMLWRDGVDRTVFSGVVDQRIMERIFF